MKTISRFFTGLLAAWFPSAPDDVMAVAKAAGVEYDDKAAEQKAKARAAQAKRAQSPASQPVPAPWFRNEGRS